MSLKKYIIFIVVVFFHLFPDDDLWFLFTSTFSGNIRPSHEFRLQVFHVCWGDLLTESIKESNKKSLFPDGFLDEFLPNRKK